MHPPGYGHEQVVAVVPAAPAGIVCVLLYFDPAAEATAVLFFIHDHFPFQAGIAVMIELPFSFLPVPPWLAGWWEEGKRTDLHISFIYASTVYCWLEAWLQKRQLPQLFGSQGTEMAASNLWLHCPHSAVSPC